MKKLLITGWSGMMGTNLRELLRTEGSDYEVVLFQGDITRKEDCIRNMRDVDTVLNFAALTYLPPSWGNPAAYTNVNYQGVVNLLECHEMFNRFYQQSTSHIYGNQESMPIVLGVNEPKPQDPYSIAKLAAEKAVVGYGEKFHFDYLISRSFNNFGPYQSLNFVIPTFIKQAIKNNIIRVRGNTEREFVYVKDHMRILKSFLDTNATGFRQVCQGKPYWIADVAEMIGKAVSPNCKIEVVKSDRPFDIQRLWGVPTIPDGFQFTPMDAALAETVTYYQ